MDNAHIEPRGKVALITGITGQDGSYLADLLLSKGYSVHGLIRRSATPNTKNIDHLISDETVYNKKFFLHYGDLEDSVSVFTAISSIMPDEVYNLAAQSHVGISFEVPEYTANVDGLGTLRLLEGIRKAGLEKTCRFYQASTSELYGKVEETPQSESTPFHPRSPYGVAKLYSYWIVRNYRESYGMFASNGILFNHESPRRGDNFVTMKIARAAARISRGLQDKLYLGNLDAKRDWGYAMDYVEGMWRILQHVKADDFVLATGETHTIREFCAAAFSYLNLDWTKYVEVDQKLVRPCEVDLLIGDASKAEKELEWKPSVTFNGLVELMVSKELERSIDNEHKR